MKGTKAVEEKTKRRENDRERTPELRKNERLDEMGFDGLRIIQDRNGFCYGIDAVLLADFAARSEKRGKRVCELGSGNGAVSLIYSRKAGPEYILAVEKLKDAADLAERNAKMNHIKNMEVMHSDILDIPVSLNGTFDMILSNPPYVSENGGLKNKNEALFSARHETTAGLDDFMSAASRLLCRGGVLNMINRPQRLADMICFGRSSGLEIKCLRMAAPMAEKAPNLVLARFSKNGNPGLLMEPELYVREQDGKYSAEIEKIYERV